MTIHPFDDGNGRIARAIADMVLSQVDGTKDRFYSMSAGIEAQQGEYYQQLESSAARQPRHHRVARVVPELPRSHDRGRE